MMELVNLINQYSGLLNVMVAFITAIITLIYVIFTYKQMKASQDSLKLAIKQFKVDKQPCIVYKTIKSEGTHCFYKQRRQLHINLKIENIGDAPVIYALSNFLIMILSWLVKQSLRAFLFQEVQP